MNGDRNKRTVPNYSKRTVPNYFSCPFYYSFCRNRYFEFDSFFYTIFSTRMKSKEVKRRHESHEKGIFLSFFEQ